MWGGILYFCPVCGTPHDDGAYYEIGKKKYFVCFECADNMTQKQIAAKIRENNGKGAKSRTAAGSKAKGSGKRAGEQTRQADP
jgi:hypothetical protein